MGFRYSSVIARPRDEVFAWHERPGAARRLVPPWLPLRITSEPASLADGRAIAVLPGGIRWIARHDPSGYRRLERFTDDMDADGPVTLALQQLLAWRHAHEFEPLGDDATRVTDRVEARVPDAVLRRVIGWRHRQLADELRALVPARDAGLRPLTVAVTGSSGLVGSALTALLGTAGHRVIRLVRRPAAGVDERRWDPLAPASDLLDGVDGVVHLAGASIFGRFTPAHREAVRSSRLVPTRLLAERAAEAQDGPRVFVSASAIGFYGPDRGDRILTEDAAAGDGFLADLASEWETAARPAENAGVRVVHIRTGIVQSPRGGMLRAFRPLFGAGLGGRLGSGKQWTSWIDLDDLVDIYHRALYDSRLTGPVNAAAPRAVRNAEYAATLARVLHRPAPLPVPRVGPRMLLGREGATELAEASQRVVPGRLQAVGHRFRHPSLEQALRHQLGKAYAIGGI